MLDHKLFHLSAADIITCWANISRIFFKLRITLVKFNLCFKWKGATYIYYGFNLTFTTKYIYTQFTQFKTFISFLWEASTTDILNVTYV